MALSLGGNQEDSLEILGRAARRLSDLLEQPLRSSFYRSEPQETASERLFLNLALVGRTPLEPEELLAVGKALELAAGRRTAARFAPRPLDIDLLLHGQRVCERPELTLPHPRLRQRRFYLVPLAEIAPDLQVPPEGVTVAELAAAPEATGWVERLDLAEGYSP